ncbi:hypothetical protein E1B28_010842 [Marasmius oreades]|uniref:DUF6533 domain-containing protein n=1 Tax=Marasmius oreades TaxID=181124 RepID=A0A9P7URG0_9AGAR|nr:uncharacterized protein E1B28_010842 [Marasmius oreades]KAG7089134.1 hypothetical protein E1B28_010842 [Marasmius oreades]
MADAAAAKFERMVVGLTHQQIIKHIDVLNATLLVYDILLNLSLEIEHIWRRQWSYLTVLYILQRYTPLFDTAAVTLQHHFALNLSPQYCDLNHKIASWSYVVGIVLSETILALRVWAVWKRSIPVGIGLSVWFLGCWIPCFVFLGKFLGAMEFAIAPFTKFRGCFISGGSNILYVCWVLLMIYDAGTLVMILIPGVGAFRRGGRSELVRTVYRDGVIYYALIFLMSTLNVIIVLTLPPDLVYLLSTFERVLHSLLTSRAVLHIRQIALHSTYPETTPSHELSTDVCFTSMMNRDPSYGIVIK